MTVAESDIDLVVQSASLGYMDSTAALRSIANIVRRAGIADVVTIIGKAKVPIIKFNTVHGADTTPYNSPDTKLHCVQDISLLT